jgi:undecaprenyl diphosphate synthase
MIKPIRSVGIILDGNRRWAKKRNLPTLDGHREGVEAIKRLAQSVPHFKKTYGLEFATLYVFSTENWNRSPEEVTYLMQLFKRGFQDIAAVMHSHDIRVRVIGERARFSPDLQTLFNTIEKQTEHNTSFTVTFAASYGGRLEIIDAVNRAIRAGMPVDEASFDALLWSAHIPDPDIIIRTSGEKRLSNFLTWKSVYSELFFIDTLWPDFTPDHLEAVFIDYQKRERRHGA